MAAGRFVIPAVIILVLVVSVLAIRRRYSPSLRDIPGPFLASFSVLWQVWHVMKGDIEWQSIRLHERHGNFVRISHKEVSVSHPDGLRAILLTPLRKGDWYKIMATPNHHFQTSISEVDPKRHALRAKNIAPAFTLTNLLKAEQHLDRLIELLMVRLGQFADTHQPVEFSKWFKYMSFDIIGEMIFSHSFGYLESGTDVGGSIATVRFLTLYVAVAGFFITLHRWTLGNPFLPKLGWLPAQHIFDTIDRAIDQRKNNPEVRFDMLEHWKRVVADHPDRMAEKDLHSSAIMTVGAATDTIDATLQALLYYLLRSPKHLDRVKAEIRSATTSKIVTFAEAQELPFLQACIKEALRMHSPVAFGLPRVVPKEGLTINGRYFEEGTILSINPWVFHRSKELFGDDAYELNPERWLKHDTSRNLEKYYIPFGAGYNSCMGRHLALIEISKVSATLLRDFDVTQVNPGQSWKYTSHFTAVPYGWPCYLSRREKV